MVDPTGLHRIFYTLSHFFKSLFFYSGNVRTAYTENGSDFPLGSGNPAKYSVSVNKYQPLSFGQYFIHGIYHLLNLYFKAYVICYRIRFGAENIIQAYFIAIFVCSY